jgi:saccharopine dehydrogenase-like NADP-dependent oxidoreductase
MIKNETVLTILGSAGGVAKSILSIINKSVVDQQDPIHSKLKTCKIHLIDHEQKDLTFYYHLFPNLKDKLVTHQFDLKDTITLLDHLKSSKTSLVIDVSWADTVEMLDCCNQLGIAYVNSALENTFVDDNEDLYQGFPLIERLRYFEKYKDQFINTTAIVCSGMNPGVVQWMAIKLLAENPDEQPLACYIVEHDTSFYKDKTRAKRNVIYTTWSPECFLDEAISSYPMFMSHRTPLFLYENVYDLEFSITLGSKKFAGCLMPHEEVYTLCKRFDFESGFIYKVNDYTTKLIRENLDDTDKIWDFEMKVLDPLDSPLDGEDLIGVLLVYPDKEKYLYNVLDNESIFADYKTNATYFQVACGIYASLSVLLNDSIPKGVYYVDELLLETNTNFEKYLTHYMTNFIIGENKQSEGLLLQRMKNYRS